MEFTFNGMVRYGFGFDNPNHAAALICMIIPLLWHWRSSMHNFWLKVIVFLPEAALYTALVFTYSRTGFFVLIIEAILWVILRYGNRLNNVKIARQYLLFPAISLLLLAGVCFFTKAHQRYFGWIINPDRSVTNRIEVMKGALAMINDNPLGVGSGRSGFIFTNFYNCPENAAYSTLVNSFLTFLVEQGIIAGFIVFLILLSALAVLFLNKNRKINIVLICILAGAVLSGTMSTCFDINILFINPPAEYDANYIALLILFAGFAALLVSALVINFKSLKRPKFNTAVTATATIVLALAYVAGNVLNNSEHKIKVNGHQILLINKNSGTRQEITVFNEKNTSLRYCVNEVLSFAPAADIILWLKAPAKPKDLINEAEHVALFGKMAYYAMDCNKPLYLFYPDENYFIEKPKKILNIKLSKVDRFGNNNYWLRLSEKNNIPLSQK